MNTGEKSKQSKVPSRKFAYYISGHLEVCALHRNHVESRPKFHVLSGTDRSISRARTRCPRHCNRIRNHHSRVACANHALVFINDMIPFPSSAAIAKSFVDSAPNRNFYRPRPLPKSNQRSLGLACGSACCRGKLVQDNMKVGRRKHRTRALTQEQRA